VSKNRVAPAHRRIIGGASLRTRAASCRQSFDWPSNGDGPLRPCHQTGETRHDGPPSFLQLWALHTPEFRSHHTNTLPTRNEQSGTAVSWQPLVTRVIGSLLDSKRKVHEQRIVKMSNANHIQHTGAASSNPYLAIATVGALYGDLAKQSYKAIRWLCGKDDAGKLISFTSRCQGTIALRIGGLF
jgi:hypothetical protein